MKNKTIAERIDFIINLVFTYLEVTVAFILVFLMISYSVNTLHLQKDNHSTMLGYMFIISAFLSFHIYIAMTFFTKNILKHKQPKIYIIHLMGAFLSAYLIVMGILDLQTDHYPEENYVHFGNNLIIMGLIGILFSQWRYKISKRKEGNQS